MDLNDWNAQDSYNEAKQYTCGYCGKSVGARTGYGKKTEIKEKSARRLVYDQFIALCPVCGKPTFWDGGKQVPGVLYGENVNNLPRQIDSLYLEARRCMSVAAYTAGAMVCRKMLMNIAVTEGAKPKLPFADYVKFLEEKGFVAPNCRMWVDHIRQKGNEAVHEIPETTQEDLAELLTFLRMLLQIVYEFPGKFPKAASQ